MFCVLVRCLCSSRRCLCSSSCWCSGSSFVSRCRVFVFDFVLVGVRVFFV